jgi:hypothetical protein
MISYGFTKELDVPFERVRESAIEELKKEGFGILTEIDVQAKFKEKLGIEFKRYVILGACHPPNAYKAILAEENIGLLFSPKRETLFQQTQTEQLLGECIDVFLCPLLTKTDGHNDDDHSLFLNSIQDAIPLADGANAPVSRKFTQQGFPLLFRILLQAVDCRMQLSPNPLVRNIPEHPLGRRRDEDRPRHRITPAPGLFQGMRFPFFISATLFLSCVIKPSSPKTSRVSSNAS